MPAPKKYQIDAFFMNEKCFLEDSEKHVSFVCFSLVDLGRTILHLTPSGYRVRTSAWFSKHLKWNNNDLELRSGLLQTKMYRIRVITEIPPFKELEHTNRSGNSYKLKIIQNGST